MTPRFLLFLAILGTLALAGVLAGTLIRSRRRYARKYLVIHREKKPPFFRWWLRKNRLLLGATVGIYLLAGLGGGYLTFHDRTARQGNRYAALIGETAADRKELWKRYVELRVVAEREPNNAELHLRLARMLRDMRMGRQAVTAYRKVLYLAPGSREARRELGCLAAVMGEANAAAAQADELARRWPGQPDHSLVRALIARQAGRSGEALEELRSALARDPGCADARTVFVELALHERLFAEAARQAEVGLKADPADNGLRFMLAKSQAGLGEHAAAEATLRIVAQRSPASPEPLLTLAGFRVGRGEYAPAMIAYEEILRRFPGNPVALNNLAMLHADHGYDLGRAGELASTLYTKYPQDAGAQDTMGWVLFRQGKLDQALPLLQNAAAALPANPAHRYHYGAALLKAGQLAAGRQELERALVLPGSFDGVAEARSLLRRRS